MSHHQTVTDDRPPSRESVGPLIDPQARQPSRGLAVLTCMDTRIDPYRILGLEPGEAHVLRNAGGLATHDTLRSLILSCHVLGISRVWVLQHTDCGLAGLDEGKFQDRVRARIGSDRPGPARFGSFEDLEANLRQHVAKIRAHPWLAPLTEVRGLVYDVHTGDVREVD